MGAAEASCPVCGKPLLGKDRFEQKCSSCREREVLGELALAADEEPGAASGVVCPACGAICPPGSPMCTECGERLPRRWRAVALGAALCSAVVLLVVAVWAAQQWAERPPPAARPSTAASLRSAPDTPTPPAAPPRPTKPSRDPLASRVREETAALLEMLRQRDYERIIDNYCQPDQEQFRRVASLLERILHGDGRASLARWSALRVRLSGDDTLKRLRNAGDPHPDYTAAFLAYLAQSPEASGSHGSAEDRARSLFRWHLAGLFEGLVLASAEVGGVEDPGEGPFVVALQCEGTPSQPRPGDDPRRIRWVKLPVGWVIRLALPERLDGIHQVLQRSPAP